MCNWSSFSWVSPFRNRRIKGYLLLPGAYRSLSRLSSALSAKASTICSFMLDQIDLCRFITQMLAPSVALIWFRFYNSFHRWNMVYRNHLVLILGHRLFSEVIQYFRCTLGCLDISSDIQCAVFKEQCLWNFFFMKKLHLWLTEQSSGKKSSFPGSFPESFPISSPLSMPSHFVWTAVVKHTTAGTEIVLHTISDVIWNYFI